MVTIRPPFPISRPSRAGLRALSRSKHAPGPDAPAIADALAEYGLGDQPTTLVDQSGRSLSLLVRTPSGAAVLKRYKASLSASSIHCQHSVLLELERRGFPCPRLRRTLDGSTLVERAGQRYDLTGFLHGYARWDRSLLPPRESLELRQGAGAALAAFHDVLEGFEPPFEHEARVATTQGAGPDALVAAIDSCLAVDIPAGAPAGSRLLWERGPQSSASLATLREQLMRADLPLTVIHGDYGPYNLLVRNERRLAVMDLELSRRDWRLIDLARAIPRFGSNRRGFSLRRARRFLVGYLRLQPLARRELELLPALSAYLDLRRSVVSWERFADSGDVDWLGAAVGHLRNSDRAQDGSHALALISQMIDVEER
jgi:Ser/Thr protein kinase RdoA (MazF antagonist)